MKKLFLGLAVIAGSLVLAQEKSASSPITFGAKAGLNISYLGSGGGVRNSKVGFNAGGFANIPVGSSFSLQPEILYSQYGGEDSGSSSIHLDYIAVPVMLQYNLTPGFYFEAGSEFGILVNDKLKTNQLGTDQTTTTKLNNVSKFNFGLGIGAGYYFTPNFGANIRYVAGVTDIAKKNSGSSFTNNVLQIGVSYKFK